MFVLSGLIFPIVTAVLYIILYVNVDEDCDEILVLCIGCYWSNSSYYYPLCVKI